MLLSFIVYISFALLLFILGWLVKSREQKRILAFNEQLPFFSWENITAIAIITIVMGLRYKTGSDYMMYWIEYLQVGKGYSFSRIGGFESGYELITRLFAWLKLHYAIYFAFWAFIQAFCLYYGLRNNKYLLPWLGLLLVLGPYSINWFSFMRQWVVTCAFVPMTILIIKRKLVLYVICTALLATIHFSAILLLVFYFLPYDKISRGKTTTYFVIFVIMVLLGIRPFWVIIFKPLVNVLPVLKYDRYVDMFVNLINGNYRIIAWGALHLITVFGHAIVILYYNKVRKYRSNDVLLPIVFSLAFIAICYDNLFINTVHFFLRPIEILYVFILIMLAYVYDYLYHNKRYIELAITLLPIISYVLINVIKAHNNPAAPMSEIINYHFFFLYSL